MAPEFLLTIAAGFAGGLFRAVIGVLKWQARTPTRLMKFSPYYFLSTILLAGLLGIMSGLYVENDPRFALLAGYAGTDFIEGIYKAKFQKRKKQLAG